MDGGTVERANVKALGAGAEVLERERVRNTYSDEIKAEALLLVDACAGNVMEAAQLSGLPYDTLYGWARGRGITAAVLLLKRERRRPIVERLGDLQHTILDAMAAKVDKANFKELALGLGIVTDKRQVLQGAPDAISANVTVKVSPEEAIRRLERLVQKGTGEVADTEWEAERAEEVIIDV